MPPCAAICRCSQSRRRKYALLLSSGSVFEPEGRGFESLPARHRFTSQEHGIRMRVRSSRANSYRLLAGPLAVQFFAVIRRAALIPQFEEALGFRDFEIPGMGGEARLAMDRAIGN